MKIFIILFPLVFLSSCVDHTSDYDKVLNKVRGPYARRICKSKQFTVGSFGGGIGGKVSIGFDAIGNLEIDEVRQLLIPLEEEFIFELNSNEELRSQWDSPANPCKVEVSLEFTKKDRTFVDPPYIAFAYVVRDTVFYSFYDKENRMLKKALIEPYEDAYRTVYGHGRVPQISPEFP